MPEGTVTFEATPGLGEWDIPVIKRSLAWAIATEGETGEATATAPEVVARERTRLRSAPEIRNRAAATSAPEG
jgi:hypothetical protein